MLSVMEDVRLVHAKCNGGCKVSTCQVINV